MWFLMNVVFDENFFNEIDHFHPNFDESVPNPSRTTSFLGDHPSMCQKYAANIHIPHLPIPGQFG